MKRIYIFLSWMLVITAAACSKKDRPSGPQPEVYIAGSERPAAGGNYKGTVWNKEEGSTLQGSDGSYFTDIFIAGSDIYTSGGADGAMYWKNGQPVRLTDGTASYNVNGIFVHNNDVYVSGQLRNSEGNLQARYWKNGQIQTLGNPISSSSATDIFVSGNDIYIAGSDEAGAVYWKNGVQTVIGSTNVFLRKIAVSGNDVYVAGRKYPEPGKVVAVYWKNGAEVILTSLQGNAGIEDIAVQNGVVHAVGYEYINGRAAARYWKNGTPVLLSDQASTNAIATGVVLDGNDVYISFYEDTPAGSRVKYWRNGQTTTVSREGFSVEAAGLALKK